MLIEGRFRADPDKVYMAVSIKLGVLQRELEVI